MKNPDDSPTATLAALHEHDTMAPRMAILDDDPIVSKVMRVHLLNSFPEATVEVYNDPVVEPGFDIYFLDNDFNGRQLGLKLLRDIRRISPHALVVALSNTLDLETVTKLTNGGCNAVYNKRFPQNSDDARDVIRNYLAVLAQMRSRKNGFSMADMIHSMKRLLGEWNQRLSDPSSSN